MDLSISRLEELKDQELDLMKQVYEQKCNYLNTKIEYLVEEIKKKNSQIYELEKVHKDNQFLHLHNELEKEKKMTNEMQRILEEESLQEIDSMKIDFENTLRNRQNQLLVKQLEYDNISKQVEQNRRLQIKDISPRKLEFLNKIAELCSQQFDYL